MPTTPIHNIYYAAGNDIASLNQITATMASSVENALNSLQGDYPVLTFKWATSAERVAQAGMSAGDIGVELDTLTWYVFDGANWELFNEITDWQSVSYQNGWADFGAPRLPMRFRRVQAETQLEGVCAPGTTTAETIMFTLPVGFRPSADLILPCTNGTTAGVGRVRIDSDGNVRIWAPAPTVFVSLSVRFGVA